MEFDELSNRVIGCALTVHRELGPGLLESTDEQCLAHELKLNGIVFKLQYPLPVEYKGAPGVRLPGRSFHRGETDR